MTEGKKFSESKKSKESKKKKIFLKKDLQKRKKVLNFVSPSRGEREKESSLKIGSTR